MNSYQAYQHGTIPNNRIRPNDLRLNYVYNRANQNIDHLKQNYCISLILFRIIIKMIHQ